MDEQFVWKKLAGRRLLETPYYAIDCDRLRHPRGHELDYYVIGYRKEAAAIIPLDEEGRILMVRQWRHPVQSQGWSVPAGSIEADEAPADAANRELREETGYEAADVQKLYHYHPMIGTARQTFHLFVGRQLQRVGEHDPAEVDALHWFTRHEARRMIRTNELTDGMSLTSLLAWMQLSEPDDR